MNSGPASIRSTWSNWLSLLDLGFPSGKQRCRYRYLQRHLKPWLLESVLHFLVVVVVVGRGWVFFILMASSHHPDLDMQPQKSTGWWWGQGRGHEVGAESKLNVLLTRKPPKASFLQDFSSLSRNTSLQSKREQEKLVLPQAAEHKQGPLGFSDTRGEGRRKQTLGSTCVTSNTSGNSRYRFHLTVYFPILFQ